MAFVRKSKLPRLPGEWYQGYATVHWTHTLDGRATGWLNQAFHARFREVLLHACGRYELVCPTYCLMPDHMHAVWMGTSERSDQLKAAAFLRKHLAPELGQAQFQDQAHDRVLRERERRRYAFQDLCGYVLSNPERAELVEDWRCWPYLGAMVPDYPVVDPRRADYWDDFWKLYYLKVGRGVRDFAATDRPDVPALPRRATGLESEAGVARRGRGGKLTAGPCAPAQGYDAGQPGGAAGPCASAQGYDAGQHGGAAGPCASAQGYGAGGEPDGGCFPR